MKTQYDAVIVGGGHNGLVAAAYLSQAGQTVRAGVPFRPALPAEPGGLPLGAALRKQSKGKIR